MTPTRQTPPARRPTLRDVARRAGVSTSTASLVFSGKGPVATATAERVRTAAIRPRVRRPRPARLLAAAGPGGHRGGGRRGAAAATPSTTRSPSPCSTASPRSSTPPGARCCSWPSRSRTPSGPSPSSRPRPSTRRSSRCAASATTRWSTTCWPAACPSWAAGAPVHPRVAHVLTDEAAAMRLTTRHVLDLGHTRVAHLSMALRPGVPTGVGHRAEVAGCRLPGCRRSARRVPLARRRRRSRRPGARPDRRGRGGRGPTAPRRPGLAAADGRRRAGRCDAAVTRPRSTSATPGSPTCRWRCGPASPTAVSAQSRASYPDAAGRLAGFRSVAGVDAPVVQAHDLTVEAGEAAGPAAARRAGLPATDRRGRPGRPARGRSGARGGVPGAAGAADLSVTGFDGVDLPWLDHVLTTVEQPGAAKGRAMGRLVRQALEGRRSPTSPSRYG